MIVIVVWAFPQMAQQGTKGGEWRSYAGENGSTRYSPADLINRDNFKNLQVAWSWKFDNFGGAWGEQRHLDRFLQAYAVEKAKLEARKKGYTATEQTLTDGAIKLTIQVGGAA